MGLSVAFGLLAMAWRARQRERAAFALVAASALALSPIGWAFYAGFLVVPLAVRHPRYSPAWLILPLFGINWWHRSLPFGGLELSVATIAVTGLLLVAAVPRPDPDRAMSRPHMSTPRPAGG